MALIDFCSFYSQWREIFQKVIQSLPHHLLLSSGGLRGNDAHWAAGSDGGCWQVMWVPHHRHHLAASASQSVKSEGNIRTGLVLKSIVRAQSLASANRSERSH